MKARRLDWSAHSVGTCLNTFLVLVKGGNVWEKAGVNISVVYGSMPPDAYRAATGVKSEVKKAVRTHALARCRLPAQQACACVLHARAPGSPLLRHVADAMCSMYFVIHLHLHSASPQVVHAKRRFA